MATRQSSPRQTVAIVGHRRGHGRPSRRSRHCWALGTFPLFGICSSAGACRQHFWMRPNSKRPTYLELLSHSAMGAPLGLFLALALLILDAQHILEMIVNSSDPELTMLVFLGTFTLSFTVGATITGWVFIAHDS